MRKFVLVLAGLCLPASALAAASQQPIEPIEVPPSVEQGLDMVYIDREIAPSMQQRDAQQHDQGIDQFKVADADMFAPVHPLYTDLRRALVRYEMRWGDLPQVQIPAGPTLKLNMTGDRVALLRQRLGLPEGTKFDAPLAAAVKEFQDVHGLKADGVAGAGTIQALNRGFKHYEDVLLLNLERARRLPQTTESGRYILVDAGSARLFMYENGKPVDSMRVIVGSKVTETPMMAALLRYVSLNPWWNTPPELATKSVAPGVLKEGLKYLTDRDYEVLSDWTDDATPIDPSTVDWQAVADGKATVRLRRGPGPWNSMGDMRFNMPNDFGIYLHDVPDFEHALFDKDDRWISNGCIRLQDAHRLAKWLFGRTMVADSKTEENVDVPDPVPVYVTYLTAEAGANGPKFRADRYNRDPALLARYFGKDQQVASAGN
ncbi:L,D-transpeptidase family protein [Sphingomonas sp. SM33]|uniref:L,D-transpeptidase family protein n=1 Tax=Sphingomonas telluris TaxID=2907998 RepID=A0ABS9VQL1_9SPHN|nr:L,D-transpeptidase family protein [Sphingomonas telluris]MCH8617255.1 L,D-transpeptidase family protein [Sphingomonas telluris]